MLRIATAPSRGGLGKTVKLYEMPRAPLLGGLSSVCETEGFCTQGESMPHRYFTTEISNGTATLRGADAHHLSRVMRGKLGDTVILCDGNAVEYTATITGFGPETVEFSVEPGYPSAAEPSVEVTLFVGYPKQDKLEQVIRHGVELGCTHFVPFFSRYCVAAPKKEEQKNERYNRIAFEAAKQCGRGVLPDVALPLPNFGAVTYR